MSEALFARVVRIPRNESKEKRLIDKYEDVFFNQVNLPLVEDSIRQSLYDIGVELDFAHEVKFIDDPASGYFGFYTPGTKEITLNVSNVEVMKDHFMRNFNLSERDAREAAVVRIYIHEMWHLLSETGIGFGGFEKQRVLGGGLDITHRALNEAITEFASQVAFAKYTRARFGFLDGEQSVVYIEYGRLIRELMYFIADATYEIDRPNKNPNQYFEDLWKVVLESYVTKDIKQKEEIFNIFKDFLGGEFLLNLSVLGWEQNLPSDIPEESVLKILNLHIKNSRLERGLGTRQSFFL